MFTFLTRNNIFHASFLTINDYGLHNLIFNLKKNTLQLYLKYSY